MDKIDIKIENIINELSLEQKASLCSGNSFWKSCELKCLNLPALTFADGPAGLKLAETNRDIAFNLSKQTTCFPAPVALASSFNPTLVERVSGAIASECIDQGVDVLCAPSINIKRSPLCGRNSEYFSEDPFLSGELGCAFVNGLQKNNVGACVKHFACNNQEYLRMSINSVVDERALNEIYLSAFERVVRIAKPRSIMCGYNKLNGEFVSQNKKLLTEILRELWGFDGIVLSDYGATVDRVLALVSGLDLEMPYPGLRNANLIIDAVRNGELDLNVLNMAASRIIKLVLAASAKTEPATMCDYSLNHKLAIAAETECAVLLKNDGNILPLELNSEIAIIGELAERCNIQPCGNSLVNPTKVVGLLDYFKENKINYSYEQGYRLNGKVGYDEKLAYNALKIAKNKKFVIVVCGLEKGTEGENCDRHNLDLPYCQNQLIEKLCQFNENVIVILQTGAPVIMPWLNKVKAVMQMYLGGQGVGMALGDLIFGKASPSGRLAETYPNALNDSLADKYFLQGPRDVEYRESIFVGYRYFERANKPVAFPFGFGLSYATFEYKNLIIENTKTFVKVTVDVKNTSAFTAQEVVQVYVGAKNPQIMCAEKELKGFCKLLIKPGQVKTAVILLDCQAFKYYNVRTKSFEFLSNEFGIFINKNVKENILRADLTLDSAMHVPCKDLRLKSYYELETSEFITDEEFELLLNEKLQTNTRFKRKEFTVNNNLLDIKHTLPGFIFGAIVKKIVKNKVDETQPIAMAEEAVMCAPLRHLTTFANCCLPYEFVVALVDCANGKFFKGSYYMLKLLPKIIKLSKLNKK